MYQGIFLVDIEDIRDDLGNVIDRRPKLGEVLDHWHVLAKDPDTGKMLVHVVVRNPKKWDALKEQLEDSDRVKKLKEHTAKIADGWADLIAKAKAGSTLHRKVARHVIHVMWEEDSTDEEGNPIKVVRRGPLEEWIAKGRPKRVGRATPPVRIMGLGDDFPEGLDISQI